MKKARRYFIFAVLFCILLSLLSRGFSKKGVMAFLMRYPEKISKRILYFFYLRTVKIVKYLLFNEQFKILSYQCNLPWLSFRIPLTPYFLIFGSKLPQIPCKSKLGQDFRTSYNDKISITKTKVFNFYIQNSKEIWTYESKNCAAPKGTECTQIFANKDVKFLTYNAFLISGICKWDFCVIADEF